MSIWQLIDLANSSRSVARGGDPVGQTWTVASYVCGWIVEWEADLLEASGILLAEDSIMVGV
ncbi:hypothetical protein PG993_012370 [Apiospora rasikravindrae]|uniref:Uncharacterized protein n=1 Tax=Apiospora rasikravindrae TaxID=990691 RepID=A0ABR1S4K8_9PEZI